MELGQEALLLPHLLLDGTGAVRQLGDVLHQGNVLGQLHPTEKGTVVLENAVLNYEERKALCIGCKISLFSPV